MEIDISINYFPCPRLPTTVTWIFPLNLNSDEFLRWPGARRAGKRIRISKCGEKERKMDVGRSTELAHEHLDSPHKDHLDFLQPSPSLFRHKGLLKTVETAQEIDQPTLTNLLNHIHFTDGSLRVLMSHPEYKETIMIYASPQPCMGSTVTCFLRDRACAGLNLQELEFLYLIIDDGGSMIVVPGTVKELTQDHMVIDLPEKALLYASARHEDMPAKGLRRSFFKTGFVH